MGVHVEPTALAPAAVQLGSWEQITLSHFLVNSSQSWMKNMRP